MTALVRTLATAAVVTALGLASGTVASAQTTTTTTTAAAALPECTPPTPDGPGPRPAVHRCRRATHHDRPGDEGQGQLPLHPRRVHRHQGAVRVLLPGE